MPPAVETNRKAAMHANNIVVMLTSWRLLNICWTTKADDILTRETKNTSPFPVVVAELRRKSECVHRLTRPLQCKLILEIIELEIVKENSIMTMFLDEVLDIRKTAVTDLAKISRRTSPVETLQRKILLCANKANQGVHAIVAVRLPHVS